MKQIVLTSLAVVLCVATLAQKEYPVQGLYKHISIEAQGQRLTDLPTPTYRSCTGDKALLVWVQPSQGFEHFTNLSWRVEMTPDPNDPYCVKIKETAPDAFILSWYNTYQSFYSFPPGIWIEETWKKVSGDDVVNRISAVATNHTAKDKLLGSWALVALQAHEQMGDSLLVARGSYKVYGEKDCLMFQGSLYNIEAGGQASLRPFHWDSANEFTEAGNKHKVTFVSPNKMTVEYQDKTNGRITETWIRHDIPEPLATLLTNFK